MENRQPAEQSMQRQKQKQSVILSECQERLDTASENEASLGHCLFSCSGVRKGVPSCRENIMCSSKVHMHTKFGRKPIFVGRFLTAVAQSGFQSRVGCAA